MAASEGMWLYEVGEHVTTNNTSVNADNELVGWCLLGFPCLLLVLDNQEFRDCDWLTGVIGVRSRYNGSVLA